jgi:hypothetical protein
MSFFSWLRNVGHHLIPLVGLLLAMQAPFTAYLLNLGVAQRTADLAFAGLGLFAATLSKGIDSWNNAKQVTAAIASAPPSAAPSVPPIA